MDDRILSICQLLQKNIKNPKCELDYSSHFTFLVAIVLSAQSTDKHVNKVTKNLFEIADTPQKMYDLGLYPLQNIIKSIGLYKNKSANIIKMSEILINRQISDIIPNNQSFLESLPGVGRKSANVFLNTIYNEPKIPVDTHVTRVSQRLQLSKNSTPAKIEEDLYKCIPEEFFTIIGNLLVLHGRYTCKAKKPLCTICILKEKCDHKKLFL